MCAVGPPNETQPKRKNVKKTAMTFMLASVPSLTRQLRNNLRSRTSNYRTVR